MIQVLVVLAIVLIPVFSLAALVAWIGRVLELDGGPMRLPHRSKPLPR